MNRLPSAPPVISGLTYVRPLGTGGFADVFLFEQNLPRRSVAVKVLLKTGVDADVLRMFNTEADVMAMLSAHPSILTVYGASVSADGRPYLVMEYCPQNPAARFRSSRMSLPDVLDIGVRMSSALETAHRAGVLHRDVKPSNILTSTFGTPVLSDFGIATSLARIDKDQLLAMSVPWSAPEVIDETSSGTVASEVFSLGATLYSLLAGRTPFEPADGSKVTTAQLQQRIRKARYIPIGRSDVPAAVDGVFAQMLAGSPSARPATLLETARRLQSLQNELGMAPTPIEVAAESWAGAPDPIDFDDGSLRAPVAGTVTVASARSRSRSAPSKPLPAPASGQDAPAASIPSRARTWLMVAGAAVLGVVASVIVMTVVR